MKTHQLKIKEEETNIRMKKTLLIIRVGSEQVQRKINIRQTYQT